MINEKIFLFQCFDLMIKILFNRYMPLKFQKNIIFAGLIFSLLNLFLFLTGVYLFWSADFGLEAVGRIYESYPWWYKFNELPGMRELLFNVLASILALLLFSLIANAGLGNLYRKTASPEMFFMLLFIISLSLEALRIGIVFMEVWTMPVYFSITITRAVIFSRIFALLCLLISSLYAVGMKYSHHSTLLAGLLILSVALASIIPIDSTIFQVNLLHKLGDKRGYLFINLILGLLMFLNYLVASLIRRSSRFLAIAGASLLLYLGKELLYFGISPFSTGLGLLFLSVGTLVFSRQIGIFYLWV